MSSKGCTCHPDASEVEALIGRARMSLDNLRRCNSGAEAHEVGTMRSIAASLMHVVETGKVCTCEARNMLRRLEAKQVAYFKRKFSEESGCDTRA